MTSTASANGSAHSLSAGPSAAGNGSTGGGGMDELLPLVLQLTNAESVSSGLFIQIPRISFLCRPGTNRLAVVGFDEVSISFGSIDLDCFCHISLPTQKNKFSFPSPSGISYSELTQTITIADIDYR